MVVENGYSEGAAAGPKGPSDVSWLFMYQRATCVVFKAANGVSREGMGQIQPVKPTGPRITLIFPSLASCSISRLLAAVCFQKSRNPSWPSKYRSLSLCRRMFCTERPGI
jgi:hypothetical protein